MQPNNASQLHYGFLKAAAQLLFAYATDKQAKCESKICDAGGAR